MKLNVSSAETKDIFYLVAKELVPGTAYESETGDTVIMLKPPTYPGGILGPHPHDYILRLNGEIRTGWCNGWTKFRPLPNKVITLTTDNEGK